MEEQATGTKTIMYAVYFGETKKSAVAVLSDGQTSIDFAAAHPKGISKVNKQLREFLSQSEHNYSLVTNAESMVATESKKQISYQPAHTFSSWTMLKHATDEGRRVLDRLRAAEKDSETPPSDEPPTLIDVAASLKTVNVYSDASLSSFSGDGCVAWVRQPTDEKELAFGVESVARSSVEILEAIAIVNAISAHKSFDVINVYSDSQGAVEKINAIVKSPGGHQAWELMKSKSSNWASYDRFISITKKKKVTISWVKGHSASKWNICADQAATFARSKFKSGMEHVAVVEETAKMLKNLNLNR